MSGFGGVLRRIWGCGGMADTGDLKSFDFGREGSNPSTPTYRLLEKGSKNGTWS